jgi:hypothetical protein
VQKKRILRIFVGYQIVSDFHSSDEIKELMCNHIARLAEEKLDVCIEFKFGDRFLAGEYLFSQVNDAILQSEITVFDISECNANVLIEVGIAYGIRKYCILLKNSASKEIAKVPSDISAFIYLEYKKLHEIAGDILNAIEAYTKSYIPSYFFFKELWNLNPTDTVYIVCPELLKPDERQNPELNEFLYLGKYGDIDSFLVLFASLSKLYPNMNLKFCTSREFNLLPGNPHSENLILLGGPDYNEVTRYYIEKRKISPYEFIVIGEDEDEIGIKHPHSESIYCASFEGDEQLKCIMDYGFFIKTKNPSNEHKKLFMINGIHTYGVYGAAKCFALHEDSEYEVANNNCKEVIFSIGSGSCFAALFQVNCVSNKIQTPCLHKHDILAL